MKIKFTVKRLPNAFYHCFLMALLFGNLGAKAQIPVIGEIRMFAGSFEPRGWAFCDGRLLEISSYETLFDIIGTTYGGDGVQTFQLPNLQDRIPVGVGQRVDGDNISLGQVFGSQNTFLTTNQIPMHKHSLNFEMMENESTSKVALANMKLGIQGFKSGRTFIPIKRFTSASNLIPLKSVTTGNAGAGMPISLEQKYVVVNYIISLYGAHPTLN